MTPNTRLSAALDERLDALPARPVEQYLAAGRSAARRRRRRRGGVALGLAAVVACAATWALPLGAAPGTGQEQRIAAGSEAAEVPVDVARAAPTASPSPSSLSVEAGLGDIEAFSTEEIPEWAQEYGNHGPVDVAPDGRLWVAPEATVLRTIQDPVASVDGGGADGVSYAVEVRWDTDRPGLTDGDGIAWSFLSRSSGSSFAGGTVDVPGRWTVDFALWAQDQALGDLGRPGFAEQLVGFASSTSDRLDPGPDVEMVRQVGGVDLGGREAGERGSAAEVRVAGQTWFVLASGPRRGQPWYEAYDPTSAGVTDLDDFLAFVREDDAS